MTEPAAPISTTPIRYRLGTAGSTTINATPREPTVFDYSQNNQFKAVSYTHLTLPTKA